MLQLIEYLAVISAAFFGVLLARSKQMDVIGVCCVAFIVALFHARATEPPGLDVVDRQA
jgi:uncharacterized membrane protein YeiH